MKPLRAAWILLFLLIIACKSTQKLYDDGLYERAIYSSVDDLKKNPDNPSAQQVLPDAYQQASKKYLADIDDARRSDKGDRVDLVHKGYNSLQKIYNAIAALPAAKTLVRPTDYTNELKEAANEAAEFHYNRGNEYLSGGGRENAIKAYEDFKMTDQYVPGYKEVSSLKDQAHEHAVINVAINSIRQQYGFYTINGSFFEKDLLWELKSIGDRNYYAFYPLSDAQFKRIRVDQFMDISLYDIWFGTLYTDNYSYTVSKQVSTPSSNPRNPPIKETVTATINVSRRVVDSRAMMDCRITDAEGRSILFSERFPARYTWENLSGEYIGDSRALSSRDRSIVNGRYNNPPSYDELYRELTKQILSDFSFKMRQLYGE